MNRNGWGMDGDTCPENSKFGETNFGLLTLDFLLLPNKKDAQRNLEQDGGL